MLWTQRAISLLVRLREWCLVSFCKPSKIQLALFDEGPQHLPKSFTIIMSNICFKVSFSKFLTLSKPEIQAKQNTLFLALQCDKAQGLRHTRSERRIWLLISPGNRQELSYINEEDTWIARSVPNSYGRFSQPKRQDIIHFHGASSREREI